MIVNAARQLGELAAAGKPVCFVGIGLPSTAANLARRLYDAAAGARLRVGVHRLEAARACRCRSATASWPRPPTPWSSVPEIFAYWLQAGRIDVGFLGGAQIDRFGNINSTVIGDYDAPAHAPARRRRRAGDRRLGRRGDGDHAPVEASVRRALRLPLLGRLRRRARATASGSGCAAAASRWVITDLGVLEPDPRHVRADGDGTAPGRDPRAGRRGHRLAGAVRRRRWPRPTRRPTTSCRRCATLQAAVIAMTPFTFDQLPCPDRVRRPARCRRSATRCDAARCRAGDARRTTR